MNNKHKLNMYQIPEHAPTFTVIELQGGKENYGCSIPVSASVTEVAERLMDFGVYVLKQESKDDR